MLKRMLFAKVVARIPSFVSFFKGFNGIDEQVLNRLLDFVSPDPPMAPVVQIFLLKIKG